MPAKQPRPVYLYEMMQRLGVDPARGVIADSELTYLTALHQCQTCPSKEKCRDWLDRAPMSFAFAPKFCPNADLLFEMQFDQPGHIGGPCNDFFKSTASKPNAGAK